MTTTTTKHTHPVVFGRRAADCPRCQELANGAAPIQWSGSRRASADAELAQAIRTHSCKASGCGIVCTFGQW